ncbi:hypothetical protein KEM56_007771 [Ascosphaera pollenicola]|nr:hypothetical protein KEM56_007771 [Ascosphaera pollenicola]
MASSKTTTKQPTPATPVTLTELATTLKSCLLEMKVGVLLTEPLLRSPKLLAHTPLPLYHPAPKPLSTKEQRELLIRCPKDPNFDPQTTLTAVNARLRKKVLGSFVGDLIFIADSATTKRAVELNVKWQTALGSEATVQPKRYTVLVHGVPTSLLPNNTQQENIASLFAANPRY